MNVSKWDRINWTGWKHIDAVLFTKCPHCSAKKKQPCSTLRKRRKGHNLIIATVKCSPHRLRLRAVEALVDRLGLTGSDSPWFKRKRIFNA